MPWSGTSTKFIALFGQPGTQAPQPTQSRHSTTWSTRLNFISNGTLASAYQLFLNILEDGIEKKGCIDLNSIGWLWLNLNTPDANEQ
jgi:hypothetical protein